MYPLTTLTVFVSLGFAAAAFGETRIDIPAAHFVGGNHSTYYVGTDDQFGDDYEHRAERKVAIFSAGVEGSSTRAEFTLERAPGGDARLEIIGLDDNHDGNTPIRIEINGETVHEGRTIFADPEHIYRPHPWKTQRFDVPAGALRQGRNTLTLTNLTDGRTDALRWMFVHQASLVMEDESEIGWELARGESFLGRIFLQGDIEPVVYPAALKDDVLHLAVGRYLVQGFSHMAAQQHNGKEMEQVIDVPAAIDVKVLRGEVLARETIERDGRDYHRFTLRDEVNTMAGRRIAYHGYPLLAMKPHEAGDLGAVRMHFVMDGQVQPSRTFTIRSWDVTMPETLPERFFLGLWGANRPADDVVAEDFGDLLRDSGFRLVFGTTNTEEAAYFDRFGIRYYTRFGPHHPSEEHPSITFEGEPNPKQADPIHLIEDEEALEYPTFQRAIAAARTEGIDGVCCDYELMADSWSDRTIAAFKRFAPEYADMTKAEIRQTCTDPETGEYQPSEDWMNFRRWLNARIVGRIQTEMRKVRPDMPYLSLASASDMPAYWWDAKGRGRFRLEDLTQEVSEVAMSVYHYDHPGGLPSIPAIVRTGLGFAEGRDVGIHLIGIFAGTLIELYRYERLHLEAWQMRQDILLAAASGGRAFHFFRADQLDGEYLSAASRAMAEVAALEPYLNDMRAADDRLDAAPVETPDYTLPISGGTTIYAKLLWSGQPERQQAQMLRIGEDGKLLVMLFNFMNAPLRQRITIEGELSAQRYRLTPLIGSSPEQQSVSAEALQGDGELVVETAAQDVTWLLLTPQ
ncbi:MAG: hypothetical protein ACODAQ_04715 [Phycisphaeraceae bacterium]